MKKKENNTVNLEKMNENEVSEYLSARWKELCKFHEGRPLAVEVVTTLRWLELTKLYYPELYKVSEDFVAESKKESMS